MFYLYIDVCYVSSIYLPICLSMYYLCLYITLIHTHTHWRKLKFITSRIVTPPQLTLFVHGCTRRICIFSETNSQAPGASVFLGDNAPHPPIPLYQNKNTGRGDSTYPLPSPSLSAGVIDGDVRSQCTFPVACQPDACWQPPTPHTPTPRAWQLLHGGEVTGETTALWG